jgi:hypothetical protein
MVIKSEPFNEVFGKIYLIPFENNKFILSQVGFGGDLGVFKGLVDQREDVGSLSPDLLFRVHYGLVSPKKFNWLDKGMLPFKDSLSRSISYLHRAVGDDECFLVTYGDDDQPVSCAAAEDYEPLATWSHEHIVARYRKLSLS